MGCSKDQWDAAKPGAFPKVFVMIGDHDSKSATGRVSGRAPRRVRTHLPLQSLMAEETARVRSHVHIRTDKASPRLSIGRTFDLLAVEEPKDGLLQLS